jgi:type IV pilus assembly protein PilQ
MVKVRSMRRTQRILLVSTAIATLGVGSSQASIFRRHKDAQPAAKASNSAAAVAGTSLTAIDADASHVTLHTSGTPAYTSYSPAPDVFVVDLTATSKGDALAIPATLPSGIASLTADEAVEMGTRLTRVTFRFSQPATPQAAAVDNSLVITLPGAAVAAAPVSAPPADITPVAATQPEKVAETPKTDVPHVEAVIEATPSPVITEPVASAVALPAVTVRAHRLNRVETSGTGDAVEVKIVGDGALRYNAFTLENPSRLVIDVTGVKNGIARPAFNVSDALVKRVRVAQFKPDVTRVVLDLASKSKYQIAQEGDHLRVTFGNAAPMQTAAVAPAAASVDVVDAKPAPAKSVADVPARVATATTEEQSSWKMPAPPKSSKSSKRAPAKAVITATATQAPPTTTRRTTTATPAPAPTTTISRENVFSDPTAANTSIAPDATGGPRILGGGTQSPGGRLISGTQKVYTGEPISLNLKEADIRDVLRTFADLTGLNMAIDPDVNGQVTVNFTDVPWDQALDIILHQNSLGYTLDGNVMRVGRVNRLAQEATAARQLEEENRLNVPLVTVIFKLSYARASEVQALLQQIATTRARIIVDARTNQLIVSEIPTTLQTMRNLIDTIDIPTRQVMIEARIVEASKVFQQQYGFQWGFSGAFDPAMGNGTGLIFPNRVGFVGGPFDFGPGNPVLQLHLSDVLGTFNLDFALNAFEFEGLVKVISAPKVTTQDNVAAQIQSGFQIPFQTRVNFTTSIQYVDATLSLQVTPQITEAGTVIMDIAVQKNEPSTGLAIEGAAGTPISTRSAKTKLMVRDGGTAVIGGIYQVKDNNSVTRLPFVSQIPILGNLFKTHNISTSHDELLIFITPRIIRGA